MLSWRPFSSAVSIALRRRRHLTLSLISLVLILLYFNSHSRLKASSLYYIRACGSVHQYTDAKSIQCLIEEGQAQFRKLRRPQSTTPDQAAHEYERRYARSPPPGFEAWVQSALDRHSILIDDGFDQIERDLAPFRARKEEAERTFRELGAHEKWDRLRRMTVRRGAFNVTDTWYAYGPDWSRLVEPFVHLLPDSVFYLNCVDEPRLLAKLYGANHDQQLEKRDDEKGEENNSFIKFHERTGESVQDLIMDSCTALGFLSEQNVVSKDKDICQVHEPAKLHGFVASPNTFSYTDSIVPVLSIARMSAFRDILIPCPCYLGHTMLDNDTIPFTQKKRALYWRGSTTGQLNQKWVWQYGHRQRFVSFINSLQSTARAFDAGRFFGIKSATVDRTKIALFKDLFDVQMGKYVQCVDDSICEEQRHALGDPSWDDEDVSLNYQYVFDIDGNSMSTRFYRLLSRRSVVLKQTMFQEWHDDRLVPWVHYIPVSLEMEELPELMAYLANTDDGRRLSQGISEAGYRWSKRVVRSVDMSLYVHRLLLEYGALFGGHDA